MCVIRKEETGADFLDSRERMVWGFVSIGVRRTEQYAIADCIIYKTKLCFYGVFVLSSS